MKYTLTLAALAAFATAQSIADLPSCSISCVANGVTGVGCGLTDFSCSCQKSAELTPLVTPCVQEACTDPADQAKVITVLEGICAAAGFPIDIPAPGGESSSAAPEPPASTSAAPEPPASTPAVPSPSAEATTGAPMPTAPGVSSSYPLPTGKPEESCVIHTVTVTVSEGGPGGPAPPYPTGPAKPTGPSPSGTGSIYPPTPEFTGAASSFKVPAFAGVVGLAALML